MAYEKKPVSFDARSDYVDAIQALRKAGKTYKERKISNALALEIGTEVLLGMYTNDTETLNAEADNLTDQANNLLNLASIKRKMAKEQEDIKKEEQRFENKIGDRIKSLANEIIESYESIVLSRKRDKIGMIASKYGLKKSALEDIFPSRYTPDNIPTFDKACEIASQLIGSN